MEGQIDVLLCDDHAAFRALVRMVLEEDPAIRVVGEAADSEAGIEAVAGLRPDVVLLDLAIPPRGGLVAIGEMHRRSPGVEIVALSGFEPERMAATALAEGAHAYVQKGVDGDELRAAIHAAARAGDSVARLDEHRRAV